MLSSQIIGNSNVHPIELGQGLKELKPYTWSHARHNVNAQLMQAVHCTWVWSLILHSFPWISLFLEKFHIVLIFIAWSYVFNVDRACLFLISSFQTVLTHASRLSFYNIGNWSKLHNQNWFDIITTFVFWNLKWVFISIYMYRHFKILIKSL